jgi:hypothetical protein
MSVYELSAEQLDELKQDMFWNDDNYGITLNYDSPEDIPDEKVFDLFDGYVFTVDDFFCTAGQY